MSAADIQYMNGFGNQFESEALPGALPKGQNSPQKPPYGLYAEQLTGSAFTAPRSSNFRSWLYRIRPSVVQRPYQQIESLYFLSPPFNLKLPRSPDQRRWDPIPHPVDSRNFIQGLITWAANGSPKQRNGAAIHLYGINHSMEHEFFYNADGEMLVVPYEGDLSFLTEFGRLNVKPGEIIVIPRGIKFQVKIDLPNCRGYVLENFGAPLKLPDLGPIGANGLANPRDFQYPVAEYVDKTGPVKLITKYHGNLFASDLHHNPLDVVAWHGNYAPYKYDLRLFNTINTVSFDHPDPSIFTVLTSQTTAPGVANVEFVIFPERWMVANNTFRPPYFHRNFMSEYMGLIYGEYDAKSAGFQPGGGSLHNCMSAHGPDADAFEKASNAELKPEYYKDTLAFMFESCLAWETTEYARESELMQTNYQDCWQKLKANFTPDKK